MTKGCLNIIDKNTVVTRIAKKGRSMVATFTVISRKLVGKSARDNPERYCGWF